MKIGLPIIKLPRRSEGLADLITSRKKKPKALFFYRLFPLAAIISFIILSLYFLPSSGADNFHRSPLLTPFSFPLKEALPQKDSGPKEPLLPPSLFKLREVVGNQQAPAVKPEVKLPEWEDPAVFNLGKEEPYAYFVPFPDVASALKMAWKTSPWYESLNGPWKFQWVEKPADKPKDFWKPEFDDRNWVNFPVPANWEVNGYGIPIYVNSAYEFAPKKPDPPHVPHDYNPVGCYRRTFTIPASWKDMEVLFILARLNLLFMSG